MDNPNPRELYRDKQVQYERWLQEACESARKVAEDMKDMEDLGDWVDTVSTLLSFAPRANPIIVDMVREERRLRGAS